MVIGFDTPSKRLAEQEAKNVQDINSPLNNSNMEAIKIDTINRLEYIGSLIIDDSFGKLSLTQKAQILMDFVYYSNIVNCL